VAPGAVLLGGLVPSYDSAGRGATGQKSPARQGTGYPGCPNISARR
jgi:hypothetical protein